MGKLDPGLKFLLAASTSDLPFLAAESAFGVEAAFDQPPRVNVLVEFRGDIERLEATGLRVRTRTESVVTGDIEIERIPALADVEGLVRAEVSRTLGHELDRALPEARVTSVHTGPPGHHGRGVIVGLIDSGIDYQHPAFRNADGTTRILRIWDQRLQPLAAEHSPAGFNFGVEYTAADIDAALASPAPLT